MLGGLIQRLGTIVAACLAAAALLVQVAAPPGFMMAQTAHGPAIVICTGHGAFDAQAALKGHPAKAPKSSADHLCAFTGRAGPAPGPVALVRAADRIAYLPAPNPAAADLQPGRGLAAPPPPSQAPPALSI